MSVPGKTPLILVVLLGGLFFQVSIASASQKINQVVRYNKMMATETASLSPVELSLVELLREREQLLRNRPQDSPRIFKNKLTIVNNKIDYLQGQIRRTRPNMITQRLVPLKDKPPVRQAAPRPEPVALEAQPPAQPQARILQPQTLPIQVSPQPLITSGAREVTQQLPEPVSMAPTASSQPRLSQPQTLVVSGKTPKTGAGWMKMSHPDKEIYILSVMANLSRRDVFLMKPYSFYIQNIDQAIAKNAQFEQEYVHRILMITAYESEPDMRKDLEKVW